MKKKQQVLLPCALLLFATAFASVLHSGVHHPTGVEEKKNASGQSNDVVIAWNNMAYTIANQHDHFYSFIGVRALAMTHIAMHDALNAISREFQSYVWNESVPGADPVCAASQAAYEVLRAIYPAKQDTLQKELDRWLSMVKDNTSKTMGIFLGKQAASAILELRKNDGHLANADYKPVEKPGHYQFTPGFNTVWKPDLSLCKPFALKSVSQFRSPAPPEISGVQYATDYDEVKAFGRKNSRVRTPDQTNNAHWWAEFGEHGWNRIGRLTAVQKRLALRETARLFALINMTLYDLYLASFDSKYAYDTWRPYTAIRNGDGDDNPATVADRAWEPEMITPPWPEYPSAHAAVAAAEAQVVSHTYGTADVAFEMESVTALPGAKTRSYTNLDHAANDCADSRIMNGYHFRFSTEEGKAQGRKIAQYMYTNFLGPVVHAKQ